MPYTNEAKNIFFARLRYECSNVSEVGVYDSASHAEAFFSAKRAQLVALSGGDGTAI